MTCSACLTKTKVKYEPGDNLFLAMSGFFLDKFYERNYPELFDGIPLSSFPHHLSIGTKKYILSGLVNATPGHFVAFSRNISGYWTQIDDLANKTHAVPSEKVIVTPELIFYTLCE